MSVTSIPFVRMVTRRPLLPVILAAALFIGVLVGVGGAYLRNHSHPQVTVVQAQGLSDVVGAVTVPQSAVVTDAGEQVVFVVVNGSVIRQPVHTAASSSGVIVVTSGLSPHAQVVTSPSGLHDGEKVRTP
jgi:multidrug efflux pump subunit AcrA (membrane-fusion protein)